MRKTITFVVILQLCLAVSSHAVDPQQMLENQRRGASPILNQLPNPQQSAQSRREGSQYPRPAQDAMSPGSQLPQPQVVNINRLQAPTGNFQAEAPETYQFQPIQALTLEKPEVSASAEAAEGAQTEVSTEVEQALNQEQQAESVEEQVATVEEPATEGEIQQDSDAVETVPVVEKDVMALAADEDSKKSPEQTQEKQSQPERRVSSM